MIIALIFVGVDLLYKVIIFYCTAKWINYKYPLLFLDSGHHRALTRVPVYTVASYWLSICLIRFIYFIHNIKLCVCVCVKSLQSCPTLFKPMDCGPLAPLSIGSLSRILEWVVLSLSQGYSGPRISCISFVSSAAEGSSQLEPPGKPITSVYI